MARLHIAFGPEGAPADIILAAAGIERDAGTARRAHARRHGSGVPAGRTGRRLARRFSVRGAALTIIDEGGGGRWTADAANFELARRGRALGAVAACASLKARRASRRRRRLRITTDTRFQTALIEFGARDARPRALFSPAALGPFAGLDAPMTATVSIGLDRERGVTLFEGDAVFGRGSADMAGGRFTSKAGACMAATTSPATNSSSIRLRSNGDRTRIGGEIRVRDVSAIMRAAPNEPAAFDISLPSVRFDVPGDVRRADRVLERAHRRRDRQRRAQHPLHAGAARRRAKARCTRRGRLYWAEAGAGDDAAHAHGHRDSTARSTGALDARTVIAVWPIGLGEGARDVPGSARSWAGASPMRRCGSISARPISRRRLARRSGGCALQRHRWRDALHLDDVAGDQCARLRAIVRGNSFDMTVPKARINGLAVTNGRVEIPRFKPRGEMATISARADGDARNMIELLLQEPLGAGRSLADRCGERDGPRQRERAPAAADAARSAVRAIGASLSTARSAISPAT